MKYLEEQDVYVINGDEMRKIQRALWMARALRAKAKAGECCAEWAFAHRDYDKKLEKYWDDKMNKWKWVERKCREKAEEYE